MTATQHRAAAAYWLDEARRFPGSDPPRRDDYHAHALRSAARELALARIHDRHADRDRLRSARRELVAALARDTGRSFADVSRVIPRVESSTLRRGVRTGG